MLYHASWLWMLTALTIGAVGLPRAPVPRRGRDLLMPRAASDPVVSTAVDRAVFVLYEHDEIIRPVLDQKRYRAVRLNNGLQVLLVSDATADVAAASINIHAGSFQDPANCQGLAHFHEHMLFLGTEKYPDEDEYESFLNERGGSANAFTGNEDTNFFFDVSADHLPGALDRFAQFFLAPSFSRDMVDREVRAIDSEHANNVPDDAWRLQQLFKNFAKADHPASGFATGNQATLAPTAERDTHALLWEFHRKWYSADRMHLCVLGKESLDELERLVLNVGLDRVRNNQSPEGNDAPRGGPSLPFSYAAGTKPFVQELGDPESQREQRVGVLREVVPVSDMRTLQVVFPLPFSTRSPTRPERYISHILGHEGEGSVYAALEQKGWILRLSSGVTLNVDDSHAFRFAVTLTEEGEAHVPEILDTMFLAIQLLRQQPMLFHVKQDIANVCELNFWFEEDTQAASFVSRASTGMRAYGCQRALSGLDIDVDQALASTEFDPHAVDVSSYLPFLTPENAIVTYVSPLHAQDTSDPTAAAAIADGPDGPDGPEWRQDTFYQTRHRTRPLSKTLVDKWRFEGVVSHGAHAVLDPATDCTLAMPPPNRFCPDTLVAQVRMLQRSGRLVVKDTLAPQRQKHEELLKELPFADSRLKLWYKSTSEFTGCPRSHVLLHASSSAAYDTPDAAMLCRLFAQAALAQLNDYTYDAFCAGLSYDMSVGPSGLLLGVSGFAEKQHVLVTHVLERLRHLLALVTDTDAATKNNKEYVALERRFELSRQELLRYFKNLAVESPLAQGDYWVRQVLEVPAHYQDEYMAVLSNTDGKCTLHAAAEAFQRLLGDCRVDLLVHTSMCNVVTPKGITELRPCLDHADADRLASSVLDLFGPRSPTAEGKQWKPRAVQLPADGQTVLVERVAEDEKNTNSAVELHLQFGSAAESAAATHPPGASWAEQPGARDPAALAALLDEASPETAKSTLRHAALDLLSHIAYPSAFQRLRTEEQLGYIVSVFPRHVAGSIGLSVVVQSSNTGPVELEQSMERWLASFGAELEAMSEEVVKSNAAALADMFVEKDKSLAEHYQRYEDELSAQRYDWARSERRALSVRRLDKTVLLAVWRKLCAADSQHRRLLRVHVYSRGHMEARVASPADDATIVVTNVAEARALKASQKLLPPRRLTWGGGLN